MSASRQNFRTVRSWSDTVDASVSAAPVRIGASARRAASCRLAAPTAGVRTIRRSGGLEDQLDVAEGQLVAVGQLALGHPDAVDLGAVGGAEIDEDERVAGGADLGVAATDVGVVEGDVALGHASEHHRLG